MIKILIVNLMLLIGFVSNGFKNDKDINTNTINVSSVTEEYSTTKVVVDENILTFNEIQKEIINRSWVICANPLLANTTEDYTYINSEMITSTYYTAEGTVIYPINEEKYALYAIDSERDEIRLEPINVFDKPHNLTGNGRVNVVCTKVSDFGSSSIFRNDDSIKMNNLCNELKIVGDDTKVNYGKVMYRSGVVGGFYSTWKYIDLEDYIDGSMALSFNENLGVQIVIIYEVKEKAPNIFKPHKYYQIRGIYQFMTSTSK